MNASKEMILEVQRLRAALERIGNICREHLEAKYEPISTVRLIQEIVKQSLAPTPTEPTEAEQVKPFHQRLVELTIEENKRIYKDGLNAPEKESESI